MKYEKPELKIVDFLALQGLAYLDDDTKSGARSGGSTEFISGQEGLGNKPPRAN